MDYTTGSVTIPLEDYDAMQYQIREDPMTRQERIDSTAHALIVCAGIGVIFTGTTAAYYWIKDKHEAKQAERVYRNSISKQNIENLKK